MVARASPSPCCRSTRRRNGRCNCSATASASESHPSPPWRWTAPIPTCSGPTAEESTLDIVAASLLAPDLEGIRSYQFNPAHRCSSRWRRRWPTDCVPAAPGDLHQRRRLRPATAPRGDQPFGVGAGCGSRGRHDRDRVRRRHRILGVRTGNHRAVQPVPGVVAHGARGGRHRIRQRRRHPPGGGVERQSGVGTGRWRLRGVVATATRLPTRRSRCRRRAARVVPDVAFVAAPATFGPIPVCTDDGHCVHKVVGGTSATAPGWRRRSPNSPMRSLPARRSLGDSGCSTRSSTHWQPTRRHVPSSATSPWATTTSIRLAAAPRRSASTPRRVGDRSTSPPCWSTCARAPRPPAGSGDASPQESLPNPATRVALQQRSRHTRESGVSDESRAGAPMKNSVLMGPDGPGCDPHRGRGGDGHHVAKRHDHVCSHHQCHRRRDTGNGRLSAPGSDANRCGSIPTRSGHYRRAGSTGRSSRCRRPTRPRHLTRRRSPRSRCHHLRRHRQTARTELRAPTAPSAWCCRRSWGTVPGARVVRPLTRRRPADVHPVPVPPSGSAQLVCAVPAPATAAPAIPGAAQFPLAAAAAPDSSLSETASSQLLGIGGNGTTITRSEPEPSQCQSPIFAFGSSTTRT